MKASIIKISRVILTLVVLSVCTTISAQIKYDSNGKLTFNAGESVTINTPFTVNAGSQIDIFTY